MSRAAQKLDETSDKADMAPVRTRREELKDQYQYGNGKWRIPGHGSLGVDGLQPSELLEMINTASEAVTEAQEQHTKAAEKKTKAIKEWNDTSRDLTEARDKRDVLKILLAEKIGVPR